jgi:xyloglucan-specific endo-beta-1,4-glucanase
MLANLVAAVCFIAVPAAAQAGAWGQCGGTGWSGPTTCVSGYTCQRENDWYFQCRPGSGTNPPPTTTGGGQQPTRPSAIASLCTQYAYHGAQGYGILNNLWGKDTATGGSQCTYYNGPSSSGGIAFSSDWTWQGDPNTVKTYIYAGRDFERKRLSEIQRLPTSVQWSYNVTNMRANVAYDIFTHPDKDHVNYNGEYELMIWLGVYGGIWPITESPTGSPVTRVTIAGYSWDLYTGWNGEMRVYSFLPANGPITSFSADVKEFFNYLIQNYNLPASQYMLIYQFGTEAFTGGPTYFNVPRFQAEVA